MQKNRVISNAKWIVICKTAQSVLQLIIGMMMARYLGPSDYGLINYAKSIVAFVAAVVPLGLNATLVKELVENPEREEQIIGTALLSGMISGLLGIVSVTGFVFVFNHNETQTIIVCMLYSISMLFQAIELIQYWFHSKLQSKYPSVVMLIVYLVVSAYKVYLLIAKKNIYWFTLIYIMEHGLTGISLLMIYWIRGRRRLKFSASLAKQLISRSTPYIWAELLLVVFQNTDHIMLKTMMGNVENGYYTAAITCVGVCQYVYLAITDSMRPVIVSHKKNNSEEYGNCVSKLYGIVVYLAVLQGIGFTALGGCLIRIMYGADYLAAIPVVRILVWYVIFSCMGVIRNIWILAEEKQHCLWKINTIGAFLNAVMNYLLIPRFGASGAAFASLMTQFLMNFVLGFVYAPIKENNRLMMRGLNPRFLIKSFRR